ncbi:MAG: hypothetical protein IPG79_17845 [Saprospiraceae bacterium]|nr:hypothetical protein [Saprospiraceae bacterium]
MRIRVDNAANAINKETIRATFVLIIRQNFLNYNFDYQQKNTKANN